MTAVLNPVLKESVMNGRIDGYPKSKADKPQAAIRLM
jgi:hypothetical protein